MNCPTCGYLMEQTDLECPRCKLMAAKSIQQPTSTQSASTAPMQNTQQSLPQNPTTASPQNSGAIGCLTYFFSFIATLIVLTLVFIIGGLVFGGYDAGLAVLMLFQALVAGWVYKDAVSLGIQKGQYPGLFDASPTMWSIGVFILPVIVMPGYLLSRSYHRQR